MTTDNAWQRLGAELRALRKIAGLPQSGIRVDDRALSQSSVSRYERGEALPSRTEVELWLAATSANDDDRQRVMTLLEAAHALGAGASGPLDDDERARIAEHLRAALRIVEGERDDD